MKRKWLFPLILCFLFCLALWTAPTAKAWETDFEKGLLEKSGAEDLYDSLDEETKDLMDQAGAEDILSGKGGGDLFSALSALVREKLTGPLKALAALTAVILLCRLAGCFAAGEAGSVASFAGALACAAVVVTPLLQVIGSARGAVEAAGVFLLASVPVYGALLAASGNPAAGSSYSFLTLAVGNAIPALSSAVIFPLLHIFLALALTASVSQVKFDKFAKSLYGFGKWLLVLAVTVFSGVLSVQTALNAQVDAATNKAAKLAASTAIPIVGGAFGDAVAAIQNSVHLVKSGLGAFGILAALCILGPPMIEAAVWIVVCYAGQMMGELFDMGKLASFLGMCVSAAKMVLAVLSSVCIVSVVSAAILLFVKGAA